MFQVPTDANDFPRTDPIQTLSNAYMNTVKTLNVQDQMAMEKQMNMAKLAEIANHNDLYSSQSKKAQAETADIPYQDMMKNLDLQAKFLAIQNSQGGMYSKFRQMTSFANTPAGAKAIATNPEMAKNFLTMANQAAYEGANPGQSGADTSPQMQQLGALMPTNKENVLGINPLQSAALDVQHLPNANGDGYQDKSGNPIQYERLSRPQQQAIDQVTNAQIQSFMDASEDHFQKSTNTANTLNQRKAVTNFVATMDAGQKYLPGYLNYIGAAKKAGMGLDKFTSTMGKNNPNLNDYNNFKTTVLKDMANEYRRIMAGNASDQEQKLVDSIVDPDQWWANPQAAVSKLNSVYETVKGFSSKLSKGQGATNQELQNFSNRQGDYYSVNGAPSAISRTTQGAPLTVNPAQLQQASPNQAQAIGITQNQPVMSSQSPRVLPIPQFNSKQEAQAWFAKQPPKIRAYLMQQQARGGI